jgi:alkylation response protein AidB-like acyl-CoA dehydrogenase
MKRILFTDEHEAFRQLARSFFEKECAPHVAQWQVVDRCLQLFGGYGYTTEYEINRLWRDSQVQRIYAGSNEVMKEIVGRSLKLDQA